MFGPNCRLACALVLVACLLIASQAAASCTPGGLKNLFCRDKSYEKLADDLYETTPLGNIKDYATAAAILYKEIGSGKQSPGYNEMLSALYFLGDYDAPVRDCDNSSMESLRRLAHSMADAGNLGPKKMTNPIRGLNWFITKHILKARARCFGYLAREWPSSWKAAEQWPESSDDLRQLDGLPRSLLLDNKPNLKAKELVQAKRVLPVCARVNGIEKADLVLRPYVNLLIASNIIDPESNKMAKFYQNPSGRSVLASVDHPNQELLDTVYRFRACELLAAKISE